MRLFRHEKREPGDLIAAREPRSVAAEAYRTLRTNIQFSTLDRQIRTLLVTSPSPTEGKSTVAANLAISMAESGRRVIAVDGDLRRPALHQLFQVGEGAGLTTMILDETLDPPLQPTLVPGLSVLRSGPLPPNPGEILASARMAAIIARLMETSDLLVFDSPPVGAVSDAAVLAARVDGVLLVVDAGRTRREAARQAKEQLERVGARLLGVVLNNARPDSSMAEYYHDGQ